MAASQSILIKTPNLRLDTRWDTDSDGVNPAVTLSTSSHTITPTVTDGDGATDTDDGEIIIWIKEMLSCTIELRE